MVLCFAGCPRGCLRPVGLAMTRKLLIGGIALALFTGLPTYFCGCDTALPGSCARFDVYAASPLVTPQTLSHGTGAGIVVYVAEDGSHQCHVRGFSGPDDVVRLAMPCIESGWRAAP